MVFMSIPDEVEYSYERLTFSQKKSSIDDDSDDDNVMDDENDDDDDTSSNSLMSPAKQGSC